MATLNVCGINSEESPLVCICIPTYNNRSTLGDTLKSILNQTYPNIVVHISDNASADGTLETIECFKDSRITVHRHEKNIGAEGNFTRCIQMATGKYTAIFHADDIYESNMVAKQVAFLQANPSAGAVFTEAKLINRNGAVIGAIFQPEVLRIAGPLHDFPSVFKAVLQHSNFLICPSVMVRTELYFQDIKRWRGDLFGSSADLDVWFRILQRYPCGILAEPLMRYRSSEVQFSAKVRSEIKRSDFFRVMDYYLEQADVRSMLNKRDLKNFEALDRRDRVMRGVNLFLADRPEEAIKLLPDLFTKDAFRAAFRNRRGLMTLLLGSFLVLASWFHFYTYGKAICVFLKRKTRR